MAVVMLAFLNLFKFQSKATRQIASSGGVNDLGHAMDLLFGNPLCASSGSYLNLGAIGVVGLAGGTYSLSLDTLGFSAGGMIAVTTNPNPAIANMIQPYTVAGITFTPLGGNSATQYPFAVTVTFGNPSGPPHTPLTKYIMVHTDAARTVVGACTLQSTGIRPTILISFATPGITNWVVPDGVTLVKARVVGGGGGGGGATLDQGGGGGGAGGYCEGYFAVTAGSSIPITVGAGGTAGGFANVHVPSVNGGPGGFSSFGAMCRGNGGAAGVSDPTGASGGNGGIGLVGAGYTGVVFRGGFGSDGVTSTSYNLCNSVHCKGGDGGASALGGGGRSGTAGGGGKDGTSPGSGGGGCYHGGPALGPGGAGAAGIVLVEY